MTRNLRLPGESNDAFITRAERAAAYARFLVDAALANLDVQDLISCPDFPIHTEQAERENPTVRVEFDQAIAIGCIGECLTATKNKSWGAGPVICPLQPDDPVLPVRITYVFKEGSGQNLRYQQRRRMKELLGKKYRRLVTAAKKSARSIFLEQLSAKDAYAIRCVLQMNPVTFWRTAKGRVFCALPDQPGRMDKAQLAAITEKPRQRMLQFD